VARRRRVRLQGFPFFFLDSYAGPFERTELFFGKEFVSSSCSSTAACWPEQPDFPTSVAQLDSLRRYSPARSSPSAGTQPPFGPAFAVLPAIFAVTVTRDRGPAARVVISCSWRLDRRRHQHAGRNHADRCSITSGVSVFRNGVKFFERIDQFPRRADRRAGRAPRRIATSRTPSGLRTSAACPNETRGWRSRPAAAGERWALERDRHDEQPRGGVAVIVERRRDRIVSSAAVRGWLPGRAASRNVTA